MNRFRDACTATLPASWASASSSAPASPSTSDGGDGRHAVIEVGPLKVSLQSRTVIRAGALYPLSSRAFALLEALLEDRGSVVSKDTLLDRAWPNTIVEENNLQVQVVALRRALGTSRDLLRTVSGRGYMLLPQPEAAPARSAAFSLGLPFVDTLFGRSDAVDDVLTLFHTQQLVTLTGAGGIGKTSLAVELCRDTGDLFVCIRYISLAPLQNDRQAREALLTIFSDVVRGSAMTVEQLASGLRKARCLVILDNCEHLIETAASIAQTLTAGNSGVRVLATSREALRIPAENVYPVPTLNCPSDTAAHDEATGSDAVKLFLHRLRRLAGDFEADATTLPLIGEICRRLDGIPLAIELAAARAATLGLDTVRAHLDDRFAILTGGSRNVLPRHQTLRAVFEWSYRLLSPTEQLLFRQASIFSDGFALEAISELMGRHDVSRAETVECLAGLVGKSLLYIDRTHQRRFRQLESSRAYAHALLDAHGETAEAAHAHAVYFREFFDKGPYKAEQIRIEDAHDLLSAEIGNMRAAMSWAFSPAGNVYLGIDLASTAVPILFELPLFEECVWWASVTLDALGNKVKPRIPHTRLRVLSVYASALVYTEGPTPAVEAAWRETLELAEASDDRSLQLRAIWGLWNQKQYAGEPLQALAHARWFQRAAQEFGSPLQVALSRRIIGISLHSAGRHAEARDELLAALAAPDMQVVRWSTTGVRTDMIAATHATLARIQWFLGDRHGSLQKIEEAEELARQAGHELTLAYVLLEATIPLAILNRDADALMLAVESLQNQCRRAGIRAWLLCCDALEWIAHAIARRLDAFELADMESAIGQMRDTAYLSLLPIVLGEFAKALHAAGDSERAQQVLDDALDHCAQCGSDWYRPMLDAERASIGEAMSTSPVDDGL
ncbi:putative ATPase/DNA-binding winged helix-turn-helix (wHTH) protein [Paraburkholderia sp. GAS199]|uniref:ATP-binding protein n=1 Tax=Paraburkholderia sp. GAS199 TaxID=3035126 RepID=UPI003D1F2DDB